MKHTAGQKVEYSPFQPERGLGVSTDPKGSHKQLEKGAWMARLFEVTDGGLVLARDFGRSAEVTDHITWLIRDSREKQTCTQ